MDKEEKAAYDKVYYIKNKEKKLAVAKVYNKVYRPKRNAFVLSTWEGYIPVETKCEVCQKVIYFNRKDRGNSIHFDHRDERNPSVKPNNWLSDHECNEVNKKLWGQFNFGNLCKRCNCFLPAINRRAILLRLVKYVFGKEYTITKGK